MSTNRSMRPGLGVQILRRKPIDQLGDETDEPGGLQRHLGLFQLTAIGVGGIIGAGIFALAGQVASGQQYGTPGGGGGAGPGVLISFLVAGLASMAAALSYAEFAGMIPKAGSAYTYGYAVLGEGAGWLIGWDLLLEYTAIVAVVGIGISGYFNYLLAQMHVNLPSWMLGAAGTVPLTNADGTPQIDPVTGTQALGGGFNIFAFVLCLLIAWLLTLGIKNAARFETVAVIVKVAIVALVIIAGAFHIETANYNPFLPNGMGAVLTGSATVFFAVFGYDAMSTAAEESKDAKKDLPKAIVWSLIISMVFYVLVCLVLTGMQNYKDIALSAAFSEAFSSIGQSWLGSIIAAGAIVGILTVMFTFMLGVTRVWYSMSRDGLLPKWFSKTSAKYHVPTRVTWIVGFGSALIAGFVPIGEAAELTNIGILLAFAIVCVSVVVLRYRSPDIPRTFRTPMMPFVPIIGVIFCVFLITKLQWFTFVRFGVWFVVGIIIYFLYSRTHSKMEMDPGGTTLNTPSVGGPPPTDDVPSQT